MPTISASLLPRIQRTPGVRLAAGAIFTPGGFFDAERRRDRHQIRPQVHLLDPARRARVADLRRRPPRRAGPTEASLDQAAAEDSDLKLGDKIKIVGQGSARTFTLIGLTHLGSASFGGASIAQVTLPVAQAITHKRGRFDQISVAADSGVSPTALKRRIAPADARLGAGRDGAGKRRPQLRRNPRQPRLLPDLPARLRLHRPLRRRLPDLQHLLDHRRPAGHRVRDAAHARRLAAPDPLDGDRRGGGDRPGRGAGRHRRRLPRRPAAQGAVRRLRDRPADDRPGARGADRDRLAARRPASSPSSPR